MAKRTPQQEHAVDRAVRIYKVIRQAAEQGLPCPENGTLAERFGCSGSAIVNAIAFLEANGMFDVERKGGFHRVVKFRDGLCTAPKGALRANQYPSDTRKKKGRK